MITCYVRYLINPSKVVARAAIKFGDDTQCIVSYERTFLRPVLS
jgi:hypothetical protein